MSKRWIFTERWGVCIHAAAATHKLSLTLSLSHTHAHARTLTHSRTHSLTHTHTLTLSHTHAHTHTHTLTHARTHTHSCTHTLTLTTSVAASVSSRWQSDNLHELTHSRPFLLISEQRLERGFPQTSGGLNAHTHTHTHTHTPLTSSICVKTESPSLTQIIRH